MKTHKLMYTNTNISSSLSSSESYSEEYSTSGLEILLDSPIFYLFISSDLCIFENFGDEVFFNSFYLIILVIFSESLQCFNLTH